MLGVKNRYGSIPKHEEGGESYTKVEVPKPDFFFFFFF